MFEALYNKWTGWLDARLKYKYWYLYVVSVTVIVIWIMSVPSYFPLTANSHPCSSCVNFQQEINRADHLLTPGKYPPGDHMAKTEFRLTVPVIAKLTGIRSMVGIFIIQEVLGIIFLICTCLLTFKLTGDKIISALITLAIGFIYAGRAAFVDTDGFTDSFAYCFLIIALFSRNKPLLLISLILAYFTDERALLSSGIVALYFFVEYLEMSGNKINLKIFAGSRLLVVFVAWGLYFAIRYWLSKTYGLHTPDDGANTIILRQWSYVFWEGLQGFWLIITGACIYLLVQKRFFILLLIVACMAAMMIVTSMVADLTRSIAYIFPVIFLSIYFMDKAVTKIQFRKLAMLVCLICFLSPASFYIAGQAPFYYQSVPMKIVGRILEKK